MKHFLKEFIIRFIPWIEEDKKIYRIYKKANNFMKKNKRYIAFYYRYKIFKRYNCIISPSAEIGENLKLPHPTGVVIGLDAKIGYNCTIYQQVTIGQKNEKYPSIGNGVTIYPGAKVVGDVKIGNNVVIGANAVVLKDLPDNCIAVGVPARIIKKDNRNE